MRPLLLAPLLLLGCGPSAAPTAPPPPATPSASAPAASAAPPASAAPAKGAHDDRWEDANESGTPITLEIILPQQGAKFPDKSADDHQCWKTIGLTGSYEKDYEQLISRCGAPTGLLPYTRPVRGKLHHKHDPRDTYVIKLRGGLCYRYFAVADGSMEDMDILITQPSGALVADDKTRSPVAIIHGDKPWCMAEDTEYHFHTEVDGPGNGHYLFVVYARPGK